MLAAGVGHALRVPERLGDEAPALLVEANATGLASSGSAAHTSTFRFLSARIAAAAASSAGETCPSGRLEQEANRRART